MRIFLWQKKKASLLISDNFPLSHVVLFFDGVIELGEALEELFLFLFRFHTRVLRFFDFKWKFIKCADL
jgi:hypothetical protein